MSFIPHNALIITGYQPEGTARIYAQCVAEGIDVLGPSAPAVNGFQTIVAVTSGSKHGWLEYDDHLRKLKNLRKWIAENRGDLGYPHFAAVSYGENVIGGHNEGAFFGEAL